MNAWLANVYLGLYNIVHNSVSLRCISTGCTKSHCAVPCWNKQCRTEQNGAKLRMLVLKKNLTKCAQTSIFLWCTNSSRILFVLAQSCAAQHKFPFSPIVPRIDKRQWTTLCSTAGRNAPLHVCAHLNRTTLSLSLSWYVYVTIKSWVCPI